MNRIILFLIILTFSLQSYSYPILPDTKMTPGGNDISVVRNVSNQELCTTSTKLVRNVSDLTKITIYKNYKIKYNDRSQCKKGFEIDHLCSLSLGCNNDPKNLWPQSYCGEYNAIMKDALEARLHSMVCKGEISKRIAQKEISTDWISAYKKYVVHK